VFVSLVNTGEVSGTLDKIMDQTATYMERAETLRLKVQAALRYPIFVMSFALLILVAMVVKIVPDVLRDLRRFQVQLPWPTRVLSPSASRGQQSVDSHGLAGLRGGMFLYFAQTERGTALDRPCQVQLAALWAL
jgi:type II secretory pathway component PulF